MKIIFAGIAIFMSVITYASDNELGNIDVPKQIGSTFSQQWGLDAINIPNSLANHSAESLGLLAPEFSLMADQTLISRQGVWLSENDPIQKYWLGQINSSSLDFSDFTSSISQSSLDINGLNAAYTRGRFTAETGLINQHTKLADSTLFYIQGAYNLVAYEKLNIALTAKVESVGDNDISAYFGGQHYLISNHANYKQQAKNTTLGLVTTYAITKEWKLMGMISSTNLDKKIEQSPLIDRNTIHMATIGTSYSF